MNIMVNGITQMKHLRQLDGLGVQYAGVLAEPVNLLTLENWQDEDLDIKPVGRFRNPEFNQFKALMDRGNFGIAHLDGDESPFLCDKISGEWELLKTVWIDLSTGTFPENVLEEFDEVCDYYFFEPIQRTNWKKEYWDLLMSVNVEKPFFIAGAFIPEDIRLLHKFKHPDFFGVCFEREVRDENGDIDMALLLSVINAVQPLRR